MADRAEPDADGGTQVINWLTERRSASGAELVRRAERYPALLAALKTLLEEVEGPGVAALDHGAIERLLAVGANARAAIETAEA